MRATVAMRLSIATALGMACSQAGATTFDACVLENVKAAQTEEAVFAIKEACINQVSVLIPAFDLSFITGTLALGQVQFTNSPSVYINIRNNSAYTVTSLSIAIKTAGNEEHYYTINQFYDVLAAGVVISGYGKDRSLYMKIASFSTKYFYSPVSESLTLVSWRIVSAKGFI
jgi:hypothetical protein